MCYVNATNGSTIVNFLDLNFVPVQIVATLSRHLDILQGALVGCWHAGRGRSQLGDGQSRHGQGWLEAGRAACRPHEHARSDATRLGRHLPGGGAGDARHGDLLGGHQGPRRLCLWSHRLPGVLKGPREDSVSSGRSPTSCHPHNYSGATSRMRGSATARPLGCRSTPTTSGSTSPIRLSICIYLYA